MHPISSGLELLLTQLDSWRHFAAYKLEQRVDVLFGVFLPEILGRAPVAAAVERTVVPEFPFPQEQLLGIESPSFRSDRIDFVAISQDRRKLYLVELKTDHASLRDEQLDKMLEVCDRAREGTALAWVSALVEVAKPSRSRQPRKYLHLLSVLEEWGLVGPLAGAYEKAWPAVRQGLTAAIESANPVHHPDCQARLEAIELVPVLVCPDTPEGRHQSGLHVVSFADAAQSLEASGRPDAMLFARYLRRWQMPPAASAPKGIEGQ